MKVRKLNYYRIFVLAVFLIVLIFLLYKLISNINYKKTYEYKLGLLGYTTQDINIVKNKLKNEQIDSLLKLKYNKNTINFINEKYFIFNNLQKYLEYKNDNKLDSYTNIVSIINTEANEDWIDKTKKTDISKNDLMLVNRIYGLSSDYVPSDIVDVSVKYAYEGVKISESIMNNILSLISDAAENENIFVLSAGYRSYKEQENIYNNYREIYGSAQADKFVARPGHSEYQTGLSFDIVPFNKNYDKPKESKEYKWLKDNAYKYGFIFRFESGKENLTGFNEDTWRMRYVGSEAASIISAENICFEEYYAYFINK